MVMPRAFSSGALSISSKARSSPPKVSAATLVKAAVNVVLPWSTWPMVPTLTCGLVRSNLLLAMNTPQTESKLTNKTFGTTNHLKVELLTRVELVTSSLPRTRSTA